MASSGVGFGSGVRVGAGGERLGRGVRIAAAGAGRLGAGGVLGVGKGLGWELALAAGISEPTGRQLGIPSRQTSAPSPSLPVRRARMSCSIVIWTNSLPPRSTYHRGLSLGAMDGCRAVAGGSERGALGRWTGLDTRSSSIRLGCCVRLRPRPLIAATAANELSMCVASSSSSSFTISIGGGGVGERRSASARSSRTNWPQSQRNTRSFRACSPFVT